MKRLRFTTITPLPATADRAAVIAVLHDLDAMIDLNPLVVARTRIPAPPGADPDEAACVWYRLTDALVPWVSDASSASSVGPASSSTLSKTISYTCAFLPLPDGLQTHCRAPLGVDIRDRWTIGGSPTSGPAGTGQPKRPTEARELGLDALGAPATGLYVREDVDLRCNVLLASFVKKTLKRAHAALAARLAEMAAAPTTATSATAADEPEDPFAPPPMGGLPPCVPEASPCRSQSPLPPLPPPPPPPPPPKPQPQQQLLLLPRTFRPPKGDERRNASITSLYPEMSPYVDAEVSPPLSSANSFSSSSSSSSKYSENNSQIKSKTTRRRRPTVLFAELSDDESSDYGMVVPVLLDTGEGQPF